MSQSAGWCQVSHGTERGRHATINRKCPSPVWIFRDLTLARTSPLMTSQPKVTRDWESKNNEPPHQCHHHCLRNLVSVIVISPPTPRTCNHFQHGLYEGTGPGYANRYCVQYSHHNPQSGSYKQQGVVMTCLILYLSARQLSCDVCRVADYLTRKQMSYNQASFFQSHGLALGSKHSPGPCARPSQH